MLVCRCAAGHRFWRLALEHTDAVLTLMELDEEGQIASADGFYGRFGMNHRGLLRAQARAHEVDDGRI